jgi:PAS domain S-box-containing protein
MDSAVFVYAGARKDLAETYQKTGTFDTQPRYDGLCSGTPRWGDAVMDPSLLLDHCPDLVSHHEASGVFGYASAAALRIVGRAPAALVGTSLVDLACPEDRAALAAAWSKAFAATGATRVRFRVERGGELAWVETNMHVVPGDDRPTAVCTTRGVTDAVREEREMAERVTKAELGWTHWEELVAVIPGIVWFAPIHEDGSRGSADFISDYLEDVLGYTPHEWLTTPNFWTSIIHPDDLERTLQATARMLRDGTPTPPYRVRGKTGRIVYFQAFMHVHRRADGKPDRLYGLTLDVTAFKEAEARSEALLVEVQRAAREREALLTEIGRRAEEMLALSAPMIPLGRRALVMPIIGTVDASRGEHILETLLRGVSERTVAILDLTGAVALEPAGADALVRAARAARMLGVRVILTGLRADVARMMVELGLELENIPTRATLTRALLDFVRLADARL